MIRRPARARSWARSLRTAPPSRRPCLRRRACSLERIQLSSSLSSLLCLHGQLRDPLLAPPGGDRLAARWHIHRRHDHWYACPVKLPSRTAMPASLGSRPFCGLHRAAMLISKLPEAVRLLQGMCMLSHAILSPNRHMQPYAWHACRQTLGGNHSAKHDVCQVQDVA